MRDRGAEPTGRRRWIPFWLGLVLPAMANLIDHRVVTEGFLPRSPAFVEIGLQDHGRGFCVQWRVIGTPTSLSQPGSFLAGTILIPQHNWQPQLVGQAVSIPG